MSIINKTIRDKYLISNSRYHNIAFYCTFLQGLALQRSKILRNYASTIITIFLFINTIAQF